jgi:single-stranded-DNA-specific exonuclease
MQSKIKIEKEKKWIIKGECSDAAKAAAKKISSALNFGPVMGYLLYNRGYETPEDAMSFINAENEFFYDPFELNDVKEAVERIRKAVDSGEKITVYGDYDVDGVTSVCTMCLYLRSCGANVDYYIPNRSGEGYGVSCAAIEALKQSGTSLIVTVDTGITANEEVEFAKSIGVDIVVTDHHECRAELPRAVAVVNPHRPDCTYPFKELAGVGVVFKLICAYEKVKSGDDMIDAVRRICKQYADLIAIGTIADVMPIRYENKLIVKGGLGMIEKSPRLGLRALMEVVSSQTDSRARYSKKAKAVKITSSYIGYTIAPRLNAAGRIRSASLAAELFLTDDEQYANEIAQELCNANKERQNEENRIMKQAYEKIEREHNFENDKVIVLDADEWHHGVIGIVASRITEKYGLPCILLSFEGCSPDSPEPTDVAKGSGRSIKGMNLVDALVHCSDCLVKYGGHELAAGLSVTRAELENFKRKINEYANLMLTDESTVPTLEADCEISFEDISLKTAREIQHLEPFGVGNPVPIFVLRSAVLLECTPISGGKHTRFVFGSENGEKTYSAIYFSCPTSQLDFFAGDRLDVMFNLDINDWADKQTAQMIVKDIRLSESARMEKKNERELFERIWRGEEFSSDLDIIPTRNDFALVYTMVEYSVRNGCDCLSHNAILSRLSQHKIGYIKLKFIIRILQEMNLIGIEEVEEELYRFKLHYSSKKTDLEKSNLLRKLRLQQK